MLKPDDPRYGSEYAAQRACYVGIRKKNWIIQPSQIAFGYFVAIKPEREESVSAKDFRELMRLVCERDAAWAEKQRARARAEAAAAEKAAE